MSEILYPAQEHFPERCVRCPWLVGLIEDAVISPDEISEQEVADALSEHAGDIDFADCDGPDVELNYQEVVITCMNPEIIRTAV